MGAQNAHFCDADLADVILLYKVDRKLTETQSAGEQIKEIAQFN